MTIGIHRITKSLVSVCVLAGIAAELQGRILYLNDFSERMSNRPLPIHGCWQEARPYGTVTAPLCNGRCDKFTNKDFYWSYYNTASLDGWFTPYWSTSSTTLEPTVYFPPDGDPCLIFRGDATDTRQGHVLQSLHNVFTSGVLRVQFDFRIPESWRMAKSKLEVFPVYDAYMDIMAWHQSKTWETVAPGGFGVRTATSDAKKIYSYPNLLKSGGAESIYSANLTGGTKWIRLVCDVDLDSEQLSGTVHDLGNNHPTLETETPSAVKVFDGGAFRVSRTAQTGGVSGIGIYSWARVAADESDGDGDKVLLDNLAISWKAPGTSAFKPVYENDFSTRRWCTLSGPTSASEIYPQPTETVSAVSDEIRNAYPYSEEQSLSETAVMPSLVQETRTTKRQPEGFDGWVRLAPDADCNGLCAVSSWDLDARSYNAKRFLDFGGNDYHTLAAQTLGERFASGKIRMVADAAIPFHAGNCTTPVDYRRVFIGLGNSALYRAAADDVETNLAVVAGIASYDPGNGMPKERPYVVGDAGMVAGNDDVDNGRWYRYEVVADLDAQTYDFSVWLIGTSNVDQNDELAGEPVFTRTGVPFAHPVSEISTFVVHGWGLGDKNHVNCQYRAKIDNIQVWKETGGEQSRLYLNIFSVRKRAIDVPHAATVLAHQYDREDGVDHWLRQSGVDDANRYLEATIRGDSGNQFLAIGRTEPGSTGMRYVQPLDAVYGADKMTICVDMRPPQVFADIHGFAMVGLGDVRHGDVASGADADVGAAALFGFCDFSGAQPPRGSSVCAFARGNDGQGGVTNYAWSAGLENDHWYRFKATLRFGDCAYDLKIFDMGETCPMPESAVGALVATMPGVRFVDQDASGVSALSISASGVGSTYGETGDDPVCVLLDNIEITQDKGLVFVIR